MQLPPDVSYRLMTYDPEAVERWEAMLSPQEQTQLLAYRQAKRRREFTLGRAAARTLLAERLGRAPEQVLLRVEESGAVVVEGTHHRVSITHADDLACAVVAERRVGVDLERIRPRHPNLHRFLLHPDERGLLDALPLDRTRAVILLWTLKEATLKARRSGLRLMPSKLRLDLDLDACAGSIMAPGDEHWQVRFTEAGDYYLAVAFEE